MDTRMWGKGGIGVYVAQLVEGLNVERLDFNAQLYSIHEQLTYPFEVPVCDVLFSPHINVPLLPTCAKKRMTTVHDVYHLDHIERFPLHRRIAVKQLYKRAVMGSDLVITVSQFSKKRILAHFPKACVEVVGLGADHLRGVEPQAVEGLPDRFYLFVGTSKPHKNRRLLEGLCIVDVFGQYSARELVWLYTHADALIFPSLYEGFGLPPLEAMSLGCPVVASHAASIPEVCGQAALYFDPCDQQDLHRALKQLDCSRSALIELGYEQVSAMQWEGCVQRHHDLLSVI